MPTDTVEVLTRALAPTTTLDVALTVEAIVFVVNNVVELTAVLTVELPTNIADVLIRALAPTTTLAVALTIPATMFAVVNVVELATVLTVEFPTTNVVELARKYVLTIVELPVLNIKLAPV